MKKFKWKKNFTFKIPHTPKPIPAYATCSRQYAYEIIVNITTIFGFAFSDTYHCWFFIMHCNIIPNKREKTPQFYKKIQLKKKILSKSSPPLTPLPPLHNSIIVNITIIWLCIIVYLQLNTINESYYLSSLFSVSMKMSTCDTSWGIVSTFCCSAHAKGGYRYVNR